VKKSYKIITDKPQMFNNSIFESFEELLGAFNLYDINKPFRIIDNNNYDITEEFQAYLDLAGYKYLDIDDVCQQLPTELIDTMNKYWNVNFVIKPNKKITRIIPYSFTIELLPCEDLKSPENFFELWKQRLLIIGFADEHNYLIIYRFAENDKKIYLLDADCRGRDMQKTNQLFIGWCDYNSFIRELLESIDNS
jgi:hypothetical protein